MARRVSIGSLKRVVWVQAVVLCLLECIEEIIQKYAAGTAVRYNHRFEATVELLLMRTVHYPFVVRFCNLLIAGRLLLGVVVRLLCLQRVFPCGDFFASGVLHVDPYRPCKTASGSFGTLT